MAHDRHGGVGRSGGGRGERHGFGPRDGSRGSGRGGGRPYRGSEEDRGASDGQRRGGRQEWHGGRQDRRAGGHGQRRGDEGGRRWHGSSGSDSQRSFQGQDRRSGAGRSAGRGGPRRDRGPAERDSRPPQRHRVREPRLAEGVEASQLEASARRELRALGRVNAENVAKHLVMVQRLLDSDPQAAYEHARYAASHAGRVAVVREAAGIAAYLSEHYQEALREIRASRRLSGIDMHRAIEADCERALGNLGRALKVAEAADPGQLDDVEEAEIAMVVSGVRHEMGQTEMGLLVVEEAIMMFRGDRETLRRLHAVRADRLEDLGRTEEAQAVRRRIGDAPQPAEQVEVFDIEAASAAELADEAAQEDQAAGPQDAADTAAGPQEGPQDEAAGWSASFKERVEAEVAELLGPTGQDPAAEHPAGNDEEDEEH